jgi:hypothetical protein
VGFHPCMAFSPADVIFTGLVTEVSLAAPASPFSAKVVSFAVDEAFKGVQGQTIEITTNPNTASCGWVSQTREIILDDFMLTPPLKERWFSGTVFLADRTPAAGAKVILIDPNDRMMNTNVTEVIADEHGRFRVKGYETFPYWIDAYIDLKSEAQSQGSVKYAPPVKLSTSGSVEGVELVISLSYRSQPYHSRP